MSHAPCMYVCTVTVYCNVVRQVRAARSTRGGPSGPQRPAGHSYTVLCHTIIDNLYSVMSPRPPIHPPVSIPVCMCMAVCAPRRAPAVRVVLVYAYYPRVDIYTCTRLYDDDWSPSRISLQPFITYLGFLFPSLFTPITLTSSYLLYLTSTWPKFYLSTI